MNKVPKLLRALIRFDAYVPHLYLAPAPQRLNGQILHLILARPGNNYPLESHPSHELPVAIPPVAIPPVAIPVHPSGIPRHGSSLRLVGL